MKHLGVISGGVTAAMSSSFLTLHHGPLAGAVVGASIGLLVGFLVSAFTSRAG